MRVRPGRKRARAAGSRLARVTAGRDKATMRKLADALADQEFNLKDKLVEARKAAELEQIDIAEMIGVDKSTISRFERLDSNPTLAMVRNYAYAVGCLVKHDVVAFPEPPIHERIDHLLEILKGTLLSPSPTVAANAVNFSLLDDVDLNVFGMQEPFLTATRPLLFGGAGVVTVHQMMGSGG